MAHRTLALSVLRRANGSGQVIAFKPGFIDLDQGQDARFRYHCSSMKINHCLLFTLISGTALILGGCGKTEVPGAVADATGVRAVELTATDSMKFNLTEIHAQPGEKLRISLTNLGQLPKQAMAHNWVLLAPMSDAEVMAVSTAAASRAPEYLPEDKSKILAHTKFLGPKETDTIEINAPSAPGEYPYLCSFPGHAAMMRGKLIVGPAKS